MVQLHSAEERHGHKGILKSLFYKKSISQLHKEFSSFGVIGTTPLTYFENKRQQILN